VETSRAFPRARVDRLALRFALISLCAFALVGTAIHLLVADAASGTARVRIDGSLAGGLLLLYALVLPLAFRTARTMRDQSVRLDGQTRQLSALVDQMPAAVWTTDRDLRITGAHGSALESIGLEPEQMAGTTLLEMFDTDDSDFEPVVAHRRALNGETVSYEMESGGRVFQTCVQPLRAGPTIIGAVGAAFDISDRMHAERSLDRLQRQHALILESAGEGIIGVGIRGNATFVNGAAARMLGWEPQELLGRNVHAVFHHSHEDGSTRPDDDCPTSLVLHDGEIRETSGDVFWRRDGSSFWVEHVTTPLRDGGHIIGAVLMFRDITQRKLAEEELRANFRLLRKSHEERRRLVAQLVNAEEEERRRIAGDIHDDSLQLMAAVGMHLYNVRRSLEDAGERQALEALEESVREAIGRLRHLLFELRPLSLDREGLAAALRLLLQETIEPLDVDWTIESRLSAEPPQQTRTILYRIGQEALANVRKHARASRVDVVLEEQGEGFLVRIADDGRGFVARPHEPKPGHLGVSAMRERAEVAGGRLHIDSVPGEGTMVEVWLPAAEEEARGAAGAVGSP
jgi:PAS domain S-box-containing protein